MLINCICVIGFRLEGVFRVSGKQVLMEQLRSALNRAGPASADCVAVLGSLLSDADVHTAASLLKLFVRELPGGLVAENLSQKFAQAFSSMSYSYK